MTGSDPDPEDDGADPGEPKTADLPGQDQFQPARINPLTVKPAEFDPYSSDAPLDTPTARCAAVRQMTVLLAMMVRTVSMGITAMIQFQDGVVTTISGEPTAKICCAAARVMILCTAMTAMMI
ncbi:MAG: hypothetical protein P8P84_08740 [Paracoccaceae bacterium]|nr:hypothetical protein [Paracoccaceae bacterium]